MWDVFEPFGPDEINPAWPRPPAAWVWLAGIGIALAAAFGIYRGLASEQFAPVVVSNPSSLNAMAPVGAVQAKPLAHDGQWSTLNGTVASSAQAAPKPAAAAAPDDDDQDQQTDEAVVGPAATSNAAARGPTPVAASPAPAGAVSSSPPGNSSDTQGLY